MSQLHRKQDLRNGTKHSKKVQNWSCQSRSENKFMLTVFFDHRGVLYSEIFKQDSYTRQTTQWSCFEWRVQLVKIRPWVK